MAHFCPKRVLVCLLLLFSGGCGGLDGSGSERGSSVTLTIQNPDETAAGTSKALSLSEVSQSKAVSNSDLSECTLTATGPNSASNTVYIPSGVAQIKATLNIPTGKSYTICAECIDTNKTMNNVGAGIKGCTSDINISASANQQVSVSALFYNLASRNSGDVKYCRVRQDSTTQMKIVCGFNGTLTATQKTTAQCNLEIDSSLKDASPETINASRSNGFVSGTKGNPYFVIGSGLSAPACNQYNTSGSKILKCTGAWGTDSDGNTTMTATLGVKQGETVASGRNARFAAACTKDGSNWIAIPSSGMAEFNTSKGGNEDVTNLAAANASCSSSRSCDSGFCNSGVCLSLSASTFTNDVTDFTGDNCGGACPQAETNGSASNARLNRPLGACFSPDGNTMYVADNAGNSIRKIDLTLSSSDSNYVTTLANGNSGTNAASGSCTANILCGPWMCVVSADGNRMYITESCSNWVRKIDLTSCQISVLAGAQTTSGLVNGSGTDARFNAPWFLVMDSDENLYLSELNNYSVRKITSGGVVTTLAGGCQGSNDGTGTAACFNNAQGLALDSTGTTLYVGDRSNTAIRVINTATGVVTTLTSGAVSMYGIALDPTETYLYLAASHRVQKVEIATGTVTTVAGQSTAGAANGNGTTATFNDLTDLRFSPDGLTLYIVDWRNNKIRKMQ